MRRSLLSSVRGCQSARTAARCLATESQAAANLRSHEQLTQRLVEERHKTRLQEIRDSPLVGDDRQAQLTKETSMRHFTGV